MTKASALMKARASPPPQPVETLPKPPETGFEHSIDLTSELEVLCEARASERVVSTSTPPPSGQRAKQPSLAGHLTALRPQEDDETRKIEQTEARGQDSGGAPHHSSP